MKRNKILAVDDNAANIEILKEILEDDYDLRTAENGTRALEVVTVFQPDLILLDVMMPDLDGYEVCRRVRENPGLRHTKIVMVSAKAMVQERLKGYAAGADDYVTKPFDEQELLSKVRVFLRLKSVEEVDQLKSNMLELMSHQVGTPLNAITVPAEILKSNDTMDDAQRRRFGELLYRNARRLQSFFERVLALSAMKSGSWKLDVAQHDLCEVIRRGIAELAPKADSRKVRIEGPEGECTAAIDPAELLKVFTAILDNAIRYSPDSGSIEVKVSGEDREAVFSVTDHGRGIEPESIPRVFDEFADLDDDDAWGRQEQGGELRHRLSLAIARQIVLLHGGSIGVESVVDSGTTFTVRVPVVQQEAGEPVREVPVEAR